MSERIISTIDVIKGVGELIVDEAKLAFHVVFRMPRSEGYRSDHPKDSPTHPEFVDVPNPIHLNRYEDEANSDYWPPDAA